MAPSRKLIIRLFLPLLSFVPICHAGTYYRTVIHRPSGTATVDAWSDGQKAKFQVVESDDPTMPVDWKIVTSGTSNLALTKPSGDCVQISRDRYEELMRKRIGLKPVGGVKLEKLLEEDGGTIAGFPARHFRFRISLNFQAQDAAAASQQFGIEEDLWVAPSIPQPPPVLNMMFTQTTGFDEVDKVMQFADIKGFRLKRTVVITLNGEYQGQSAIEVKQLREESLPPSIFALPANCSPLQMQ